MKKIIAAFDGLKYSEATSRYAIEIAEQTCAHLVGVFLDDFTYTSYKLYDLVKETVSEKELKKYEAKDNDTRSGAVEAFETACRDAGVQCSIHHDKNIALKELLHESIYADLLIIDRKETLKHYEEHMPTTFIRDMLSDVQCPVLLISSKYIPVEKIIILYDGTPSSVHAVKMFSYLIPEMANYPTEVLSVKGFYDDLHVPDNRLIKEFMKRHSPKAIYKVLNGHPEREIVDHIKSQNENGLIVMGAYNRNQVSRWFRHSMADEIMKALALPVFVAHSK